MASPVHICCASDEKARFGATEIAVAATAKRSAILLVWWKVIDASPRLRAVLAAIHWGRCTRLALPHTSSITWNDTRCGCSNSADVRIKSAAPPSCELCANVLKLQWPVSTLS
jgi:hypothetical protein